LSFATFQKKKTKKIFQKTPKKKGFSTTNSTFVPQKPVRNRVFLGVSRQVFEAYPRGQRLLIQLPSTWRAQDVVTAAYKASVPEEGKFAGLRHDKI